MSKARPQIQNKRGAEVYRLRGCQVRATPAEFIYSLYCKDTTCSPVRAAIDDGMGPEK